MSDSMFTWNVTVIEKSVGKEFVLTLTPAGRIRDMEEYQE